MLNQRQRLSDLRASAKSLPGASARAAWRRRAGRSRGRARRATTPPAARTAGIDRSSQNPALVSLPVTIAKRRLVELAGRKTREIVLEIDRPRTFQMREMLAAKGDQFRFGLSSRLNVRHELHDGLDLLAHFLVGHAEHR